MDDWARERRGRGLAACPLPSCPRGIFAYINDGEAVDWQSSIDIVLRRFAEYHDLEGAFGLRSHSFRFDPALSKPRCCWEQPIRKRGNRMTTASSADARRDGLVERLFGSALAN